jgi:uncharacterized membrane protein
MSNERYNGWHNYATWRVNLELVDGMDEHWAEIIEEMEGETDGDITYAVREAVQEYVEEILDQGACECKLTRSYAQAFISDVAWYEIAKHIIGAYNIEKEYEQPKA